MSIVGGVEDDAHGYSANIPITAVPEAGASKANSSFASAGIMTGKQDPMMGFPDGIRFQPYAYFRNIGREPIRLSSTLFYTVAGKAESKALPELPIAPDHSRELAVADLVQDLKIDGAVTLAYSYSGQAGALLAATGSVDETGNYVFEVEPRAVGQSASKSVIYWQVIDGFDTMYTLWNSSKQAQDLLLVFYYGANQTYEYPVHLDACGSTMVDIKQLAEMALPDRNGHVLPPSATEGSLVVAAGNGSEYDAINVVVSGGIYNPKTATCGNICETCNGCTSFPSNLSPNPLNVSVGGTGLMNAQCPYYNGTTYNFNGSASWSSNNTGIATVQSNNGSNPGLVSGIAPGSATITASAQGVPTNAGQICSNYTLPPCPTGSPSQSGSANVIGIQVFNSGTQISKNQTVYISAAPQMPNIQASMANGVAGSPVQWSLNVSYTAGDSVTYSGSFSGSTAGNATWTIPWSSYFVGGTATLTAQYQNNSYSFPFSIQGTNPSAASIDGYINGEGGPFFWPLMISWESSYRQFSGTLPLFGAPHGFGLSQVDPPPSVSDLWAWTVNLSDGLAQLNSKYSHATNFWNNQIQQWQSYNATHPKSPFPPPGAYSAGGPCTFDYPVQSGTYDYGQAEWIKEYNGAAVEFISFLATGGANGGPIWLINDSPNAYVEHVCQSPRL